MSATHPGSSSRFALDAGWEIAPDAGGPWRPIGAPMPVAAALAALGEWSLDGPPRRFDAETWWYRVHFDAPAIDSAGALTLGFDGLATCCEVFLNGRSILASRSMFRPHELELPPSAWRARDNELLIRFDALDRQLAPRRARPRWRAPMVEHQQLRWFRTTLLGRTPGWSPAAAVVGPWRGIWLDAGVRDAPQVLLRAASFEDGIARLRLAVRAPTPGLELEACLLDAEGGVTAAWPLVSDADGIQRADHRLPGVEAWWPHTHGTPSLYGLVLRSRGANACVWPQGRVGFRSVAIDTGADGEGFGLVVNGVPVFARGVCWVPLDTLRLHARAEDYRTAVGRLRGAGANLVRVGGTMVYEHAAFFEACDEAGLMVWQEFMFANMDYPAGDAAFDADVEAEAAAQLALWRAHACVAVVCGNSEVAQQAAMWGADRATWAPALFHETLARQVAAMLPGVPWWPSSAFGGAFPFQPAAGTTSYYGVGAYLRRLEDARTSGLRFATECLALAQVPDDAALGRLAALQDGVPVRTHQPLWKERVPRDLGAGWDFDDVRDHYLEQAFGRPASDVRRGELADYWALSRAASGETLAAAFNQWRDPASSCRGALVWFLRDLRAGAGWGLFDELGHPKAVLHALARVWQPVHLGLLDEGQNGILAVLVNETPRPLDGVLELAFLQRGEVAIDRVAQRVSVAAHGALRMNALAGATGFHDLNGSYRFGPPAADTVVATLHDAHGMLLRETLLFLRPPGANVPLQRVDIGLQAQARRTGAGAGAVRVTLSARAAARGVHFDSPGWRPSDEYFDLAPGRAREVEFVPVASAVPPAWYARVSAVNALEAAPVVLAEGA